MWFYTPSAISATSATARNSRGCAKHTINMKRYSQKRCARFCTTHIECFMQGAINSPDNRPHETERFLLLLNQLGWRRLRSRQVLDELSKPPDERIAVKTPQPRCLMRNSTAQRLAASIYSIFNGEVSDVHAALDRGVWLKCHHHTSLTSPLKIDYGCSQSLCCAVLFVIKHRG